MLFLSLELLGFAGSAVAISGKTSASVPKVVTSFFDARLRLRCPVDLSLDFLTLDSSRERFIRRLSFFVVLKVTSDFGNEVGCWVRFLGLMAAML